jgi:hypothetical protein
MAGVFRAEREITLTQKWEEMVINRKCWLGLLAVALTFFLTSCADEGPYDYPPPPYGYYEYYYYPDGEVYYYPYRHVYWWRDHDRWVSGRHVPGNIELHEHVRVDLDSRQPWRYHDEIRQRYPHGSGRIEAPRPQPRPGPGPRPEGHPGMEGQPERH